VDDFALWATACETALWPAGTFIRAYAANRKAAIEGIIDADPIAACVTGAHDRQTCLNQNSVYVCWAY
jgi:hypothetical protein